MKLRRCADHHKHAVTVHPGSPGNSETSRTKIAGNYFLSHNFRHVISMKSEARIYYFIRTRIHLLDWIPTFVGMTSFIRYAAVLLFWTHSIEFAALCWINVIKATIM